MSNERRSEGETVVCMGKGNFFFFKNGRANRNHIYFKEESMTQ